MVLRDVESSIRVSPRTRDRVRSEAARLGYTPNHAARALRTGRTHAIGVAVRQLRSPFFAAVVEGIEATCRAAGYHLLLGHVQSNEQTEREIVGLFARGRIDGLLVAGELPHDAQVIQMALERGIPTVLVARPAVGSAPGVTLDHASAIGLALDHLAQLGHRSVALRMAADPASTPVSRARVELARAYAASKGWPPPLAFDADHLGADGLRTWLMGAVAADPPLTAVLASDAVAAHLLKAAEAAQIPVPGRLSIVALDGTEVTTYTTPELTSVSQPLEELGAAGVQLLLGLIGPPYQRPQLAQPAATTLLAPAFTVRGSTGPAPRAA